MAPCIGCYAMINNTSKSLVDVMVYDNQVTGGWFGIVTLFVIFIIAYMGMSAYPKEQAMTASLFLVSVLGTFLAILGIVQPYIPAATFIITALTVIFMM